MIEILTHTPLWVWALLAVLVALGVSQARVQRLARPRLIVLPAVMVALGLNSSWPTFNAHPAMLAAWLAAFAGCAFAGRRWRAASGTIWNAQQSRLLVPGSWLPLALILVVFWLRYGLAVGFVLHPAWRDDLALLAAVSLLYGAIAGIFAGRSLGLLALCRPAAIPAAGACSAGASPSV